MLSLARVIDLYFESVFTNEKEDVDEENHVYLKKAEYKELGFIEEHRTALFHYILEHAPNKIYIPDSVKLRSKEYVIGNMMSCFNGLIRSLKSRTTTMTLFKSRTYYTQVSNSLV